MVNMDGGYGEEGRLREGGEYSLAVEEEEKEYWVKGREDDRERLSFAYKKKPIPLSSPLYSPQLSAALLSSHKTDNGSVRRDKKYRLAIASLLEQYPNRVEIVQLDESNGEIRSDPNLSFEHPYPPTKTIFIPDKECQKPDLLATSSDFLRVWRINDEQPRVELKSLLNGNKNSEFCGPLTSFDWNEAEPRRIGTSSIDTTCTIWDIERETVDTQLIAHDKEVYDIAWGGVGVFASVSADGSVRVFDLRDKEHSTIIYESSEPDTPLVRLGWNKQDPRYMATIIMDSAKVVVLDIRFPTLPVVELQRHHSSVNAVAWAPHSSCHICTAGDDSQALIWDLSSMGQPVEGGLDPILAYTAGAEIEQLQWSSSQPDWVAIAFSTKLQILRSRSAIRLFWQAQGQVLESEEKRCCCGHWLELLRCLIWEAGGKLQDVYAVGNGP
ncbi:hypothetical protein POTOM_008812 [Populus tomentosa]|uniref:Uncharacterized protein n=1 Tax=Populus tomentosa TaxID=118781 RepID=A0A8X8AD20_POPTO|nr:hypothetical protein POTOM_008812 [Populus tomentosa]